MENKNNKEMYQKIFNELSKESDKDSAILTKDAKPETAPQKSGLNIRDDSYTDLTHHYVDNYAKTHNQKYWLKLSFFIIVMAVYILVICGSLFAILYSLISGKGNLEIILGSVASIIATIVTIPIIIAKYLFPRGEDRQMSKMINRMQDYDNKIRLIEDLEDDK